MRMTDKKVRAIIRQIALGEPTANEILFFALRFCEQQEKLPQSNPIWKRRSEILKNLIVKQNMGLLHSCINRVCWNQQYDEDVIWSEAYFAYARCIRCFDPYRGYKWTTYVCNGIFRAIYRAIQQRKVWNLIDDDDNMVPTEPPVLPSDEELRIRSIIATNEAQLDEREMDIIKSRFYGEKVTFQVLGQKYGLSKERIRQLQKIALRKIRQILSPEPITTVA